MSPMEILKNSRATVALESAKWKPIEKMRLRPIFNDEGIGRGRLYGRQPSVWAWKPGKHYMVARYYTPGCQVEYNRVYTWEIDVPDDGREYQVDFPHKMFAEGEVVNVPIQILTRDWMGNSEFRREEPETV